MQDKPPADTAATGGYKKFKKYLRKLKSTYTSTICPE